MQLKMFYFTSLNFTTLRQWTGQVLAILYETGNTQFNHTFNTQ